MPLTAGTRLGSHEIIAVLGKGGMGEVYRARDTKLKRDVAIKLLPDEFSRDPDRVSRFGREAEVLASLNHPNIATIYNFEEADGIRFLTLELVEGETLAEGIRQGALPLKEALDIAHQMAEAVEAAHEKGVVHRDLKPANVKITPEGRVKVLDFGLAKAMEVSPKYSSGDAATLIGAPEGYSHSPTLSLAMTNAGVLLGTAAYMSPEQANGLAADARSDIFAFGSVLFEMLSGRQAFQGKTISEVLASVLVRDPDWSRLPPNLHPRITDLIRRCLEKEVKRRWQAIGDVRGELERFLADPAGSVAIPLGATKQPLWKRAIPILATAFVVAAIAGTTVWNLKPNTTPLVSRFPFVLPEGQLFNRSPGQEIALSPDGTKLVYAASGQLFLKQMSEMESKPIPGTDLDASRPFFSPDGQSIAFYSFKDSALKKIPIAGGAAIPICKASAPLGQSWDGDHIVFGQSQKGILRVSENGGDPETLVPIKPEEGIAYGPQILDHGRAVLFSLAPVSDKLRERWDQAQVIIESLPSHNRQVVLRGGSDARYVSTGHLVYAVGADVLAVPFDLSSRKVSGATVSVIQGILRASQGQTGVAHLTFSSNGTLAYIPSNAGDPLTGRTSLAFVDWNGKAQPIPLQPSRYMSPRLSPDGKQIALVSGDTNEEAVSIYDRVGSSGLRRLTLEGASTQPVWSHDGMYLFFRSVRNGFAGIFRQLANGTGTPELLLKGRPTVSFGYIPFGYIPTSADSAGKVLAFDSGNDQLNAHVWMLPFDGDHKEKLLIESPNQQAHAAFSPNGHWLAYISTELDGTRPEIFVQAYPKGAKYKISTGGGGAPLWSRDGAHLFYYWDSRLFAVDVLTSDNAFTWRPPKPLPITGIVQGVGNPLNYDITLDGQQFIVVLPESRTETSRLPNAQINFVLNWFEELKQRGPQR